MNWAKKSHRLQIPAKRYRIGELVRYSPFSRQTIHNYTIMGLIREAEWTEGGHRLYDESVFGRLARILEMRETMSLAEIRRALNQEEARQSASIARPSTRPHVQVAPCHNNENGGQDEEGADSSTDTS